MLLRERLDLLAELVTAFATPEVALAVEQAATLVADDDVTLSPQEHVALLVLRSRVSAARPQAFAVEGLGVYDATNPILVGLAGRGLVRKDGLAITLTEAGDLAVAGLGSLD